MGDLLSLSGCRVQRRMREDREPMWAYVRLPFHSTFLCSLQSVCHTSLPTSSMRSACHQTHYNLCIHKSSTSTKSGHRFLMIPDDSWVKWMLTLESCTSSVVCIAHSIVSPHASPNAIGELYHRCQARARPQPDDLHKAKTGKDWKHLETKKERHNWHKG